MTVLLENYAIELVLVLLLILAVVVAYIWKKRKPSATAQMELILQSVKRDEIKEIIIPDGIGGLLEIEHIILMDQGLLLIETYPISGNLYGAEQIDQWTQIVDGRSFKFANPLRRIRTSRQALKLLAPNVPIFCRVVFNADSHFPKGKLEEVSILETLAADIQPMVDSPKFTDKAKTDWQRCLRIARKNGQAVMRDGDS